MEVGAAPGGSANGKPGPLLPIQFGGKEFCNQIIVKGF